MADTKKTGSDEPPQTAPISIEVDEELSDADLDQAIAESDPDFLKTIGEIANDKGLSVSQIVVSDEDQALNEEKAAWEKSGKLARTFYKVLPFLPFLSLKLKKWKFSIFSFLRADYIRLANFFYFLATDGKNKLLAKIKGGIGAITEFVSESFRQFRYLSGKLKLAVFGIIILFLGTSFFIYRSVTRGVVPIKDELFIPSLERVASEVYEYNPATEVEPFYDNLRAPTNILLIPKVVVNLKKSSLSGANPMGAFEFYIEGMSPEAVIEIKDREVEIRDRIQRGLEEITFDQADSPEGKKYLVEKIKKEVNLLLTTGKIKRIWIKTVLLKP